MSGWRYVIRWHPILPFYARFEVYSDTTKLIVGSRWGLYPRERATKAALSFAADYCKEPS